MTYPLARDGVVFLGLVTIAAAMGMSGCTTHQCDAYTATIGENGGTGTWELQGCQANTSNCLLIWQSNPTVGESPDGGPAWQWFPGNRTDEFLFPPLPPVPSGMVADFNYAQPLAYVAVTPPDTFDTDANFIVGSGNIAEFRWLSPSGLSISNTTCAGYWLLVTLAVPVLAGADGGTASTGDSEI
jgi:hypothetical protein